MQDKATLNPTPDQTFEIVGQGAYDFVRVLTHSKQLQRQGRVEEACNERFHAFQRISELLPEDEEVILEWEDPNTRASLRRLIWLSAIRPMAVTLTTSPESEAVGSPPTRPTSYWAERSR